MSPSIKISLLALGLLLNGTVAGITQTMNKNTNQTETATFGGGCFWCLDAVYRLLPGVKSIASGYAGGKTENPTYEEVCGGNTGHAEVIQIEFDPQVISFTTVLDYFWDAHDPTTLNRQGSDVGTQYRSIILFHDEKQRLLAEKSKLEAAHKFRSPIVTEIVPLKKFYKAEKYHQDYYSNNPDQGYSRAVILPKVEKIKKVLKEKPH
jgi:peptide-methionine (S)-S-oxide reductase